MPAQNSRSVHGLLSPLLYGMTAASSPWSSSISPSGPGRVRLWIVKLTRARTLTIVVCMCIGFTLIFAFVFHLGVSALLPGTLILVIGVYYTFRGYNKFR